MKPISKRTKITLLTLLILLLLSLQQVNTVETRQHKPDLLSSKVRLELLTNHYWRIESKRGGLSGNTAEQHAAMTQILGQIHTELVWQQDPKRTE